MEAESVHNPTRESKHCDAPVLCANETDRVMRRKPPTTWVSHFLEKGERENQHTLSSAALNHSIASGEAVSLKPTGSKNPMGAWMPGMSITVLSDWKVVSRIPTGVNATADARFTLFGVGVNATAEPQKREKTKKVTDIWSRRREDSLQETQLLGRSSVRFFWARGQKTGPIIRERKEEEKEERKGKKEEKKRKEKEEKKKKRRKKRGGGKGEERRREKEGERGRRRRESIERKRARKSAKEKKRDEEEKGIIYILPAPLSPLSSIFERPALSSAH